MCTDEEDADEDDAVDDNADDAENDPDQDADEDADDEADGDAAEPDDDDAADDAVDATERPICAPLPGIMAISGGHERGNMREHVGFAASLSRKNCDYDWEGCAESLR